MINVNLHWDGYSMDVAEDIAEHFDENALRDAVKDGSLAEWLEDLMEDGMAARVREIAAGGTEGPDFAARIIEALELDAEAARKSAERIAREREAREAAERAARAAAERGEEEMGLAEERLAAGDAVGARKWYRAAAERGSAEAQYALARLLLGGFGWFGPVGLRWLAFATEAETAEGLKWLRKAAEQGHAGAQTVLGYCFLAGKVGTTVEQREEAAAEWFRNAAEQGNARGQYWFGLCCQAGCGVRGMAGEARKWLEAAAAQGHKGARNELEGKGTPFGLLRMMPIWGFDPPKDGGRE